MSKTTQQPQKNASPTPVTPQREEEKVFRQAQTPTVNPQQITPSQVPYLQRTIGNRAVAQLLHQQGAGQIQRAPQAEIQRNYPHGRSAGPQLKDEEGLKALEQTQQPPLNAIQRTHEEDEEEGES